MLVFFLYTMQFTLPEPSLAEPQDGLFCVVCPLASATGVMWSMVPAVSLPPTAGGACQETPPISAPMFWAQIKCPVPLFEGAQAIAVACGPASKLVNVVCADSGVQTIGNMPMII